MLTLYDFNYSLSEIIYRGIGNYKISSCMAVMNGVSKCTPSFIVVNYKECTVHCTINEFDWAICIFLVENTRNVILAVFD